MIATILPSGSNFFAVDYNERKVSKGVARLLEIQNFPLSIMQHPTSAALRNYLLAYSAKNDRIKNTQFHVAISCKGREHTEAELVDFAQHWLAEMGYADKGQPLLIYAHSDTANTHIHIVTSRVNPLGRKIDHNHERRRSQVAISKILGSNQRQEVDRIIKDSLQYRFSSLNQFKAIIESQGAETYIKDDTLLVKKGGSVQGRLSIADITAVLNKSQPDTARIKQLQAVMRRYQAAAGDRAELQRELKTKFGISLIFFGKVDSPYGYMIVDHSTKQVFNGAQIMKIKELLDFTAPAERFQRVDMTIQQELMTRPFATTADINRMLRRQFRTQIKKGCVTYNGVSFPLNQGLTARLKMNDRIAWANSFSPSNQAECDAIAFFAGLPTSYGLYPVGQNPNHSKTLITIYGLLNTPNGISPTPGSFYNGVRSAGIIIITHGGNTFAIDRQNKTIVNLTDLGITLPLRPVQQRDNRGRSGARGSSPVSGHGLKREWEIRRGLGDEVDGERNMKR